MSDLICPILLLKEKTEHSYLVRCMEDRCGFYNPSIRACGMTVLSPYDLQRILAGMQQGSRSGGIEIMPRRNGPRVV
jgi:hypothetical protein